MKTFSEYCQQMNEFGPVALEMQPATQRLSSPAFVNAFQTVTNTLLGVMAGLEEIAPNEAYDLREKFIAFHQAYDSMAKKLKGQ